MAEETFKSHPLKITVATIITLALFIVVATWNGANLYAGVDKRITALEIESQRGSRFTQEDGKALRKEHKDEIAIVNQKLDKVIDLLIKRR